MKIAQVGAWNRNWGDCAIRVSTQKLLRAIAPNGDVSFWEIDCQNQYFDTSFIADVNRHADLLLIGGGGLLWDKPELSSPSGWQWQVRTGDIRAIEIPIVVYAIGWTAFPYLDVTAEHSELRPSLAVLASEAALFSVRDQGTRRKLGWLGLDDSRIEVIPDPAFCLRQQRPARLDLFSPDRPTVGLCPAGDKPEMRYGSKRYDFWDRLAAGLRALDAHYVIFEHVAECDFPIVKMLTERLSEHHPVTRVARDSIRSSEPEDLAASYAACDVVLSMRKHGLIIPAGQGVPVIGLGEMDEIQWLLDDLGGIVLGNDTTESEFLRATKGILSNRERIKVHLETLRMKLRKRLRTFNSRALALP